MTGLPRRRRPIAPERQANVNDAMVPGSLARHALPQVAPVVGKKRLDARSRGITSTVEVTGRTSKVDEYITLTSSGAQDLALTYLPSTDSWNLQLNGVGGLPGTDFTISGQTLSLLTPLDARVGDVVWIQYDYLTGVPTTPVNGVLDLNVPYGSAGWKYQNALGDISWAGTSFDDSAWPTGKGVLAHTGASGYTSPFTDGSSGLAGSTAGIGTDVGVAVAAGGLGVDGNLWLRRWFPAGTGIVVKVDATNGLSGFYVNGTLIGSRSTSARAVTGSSIADKTANWLLAVHVQAVAGAAWAAVDVEVTGTPT